MNTNNKIVLNFDDAVIDGLEISLEKINGTCLSLNLTGRIDTYNTDLFQMKVKMAIDTGFCQLVFNCTKLHYLSSTGIGSFAGYLKTVKPMGGDIALSGIQPMVHEVFLLLGFTNFFKICGSQDEAVKFFNNVHEKKAEGFPILFQCPGCSKKLRVGKAGRFRCGKCKSILAIDDNCNVLKE